MKVMCVALLVVTACASGEYQVPERGQPTRVERTGACFEGRVRVPATLSAPDARQADAAFSLLSSFAWASRRSMPPEAELVASALATYDGRKLRVRVVSTLIERPRDYGEVICASGGLGFERPRCAFVTGDGGAAVLAVELMRRFNGLSGSPSCPWQPPPSGQERLTVEVSRFRWIEARQQYAFEYTFTWYGELP